RRFAERLDSAAAIAVREAADPLASSPLLNEERASHSRFNLDTTRAAGSSERSVGPGFSQGFDVRDLVQARVSGRQRTVFFFARSRALDVLPRTAFRIRSRRHSLTLSTSTRH